MTNKATWLSVIVLASATLAGSAYWLVPPQQPQNLPAISIATLDGKPLALTPAPAVLVSFWATSCVICLREMPELVRLHEVYADRGLQIIAVAMPYDPPNRVLDYQRQKELPFPVGLDVQGKAMMAFDDVPGTPAYFLFDLNGHLDWRGLGATQPGEIEDRIQRLLESG